MTQLEFLQARVEALEKEVERLNLILAKDIEVVEPETL